jgi:hypothetical protein
MSETTFNEPRPSKSQHWLSGEKLIKARLKPVPNLLEEDRHLSLQARAQSTFLPPPAFLLLANVVSSRIFCRSLSLTRTSDYVSSFRHFSDVKDLHLAFFADLLVFVCFNHVTQFAVLSPSLSSRETHDVRNLFTVFPNVHLISDFTIEAPISILCDDAIVAAELTENSVLSATPLTPL